MGKRKSEDLDEEKIRKKIKKLQKKLESRSSRGRDENSSTTQPPTSEQESPAQEENKLPEPDFEIVAEDDEIPEEYLLALGNEGQEKIEMGEEIRQELASRWSKIMSSGLEKEAVENITKKYPTPKNFTNARAPVLNPEIQASVSEITIKRDKRIISRQNMMGKIMSCLGKSLSSVLKGNINTKTLIEEISDAAKLSAEVFHQDSSSRKFFALAGATHTVKEAVRDATPDEFLFGKDCGEKIKTAQLLKKTSTQIKATDSETPKVAPKTNRPPKRQGNWRGPPQQHQRVRGGQRPKPQRTQYFNRNQPRDQRRQQHHRYKPSYRR